MINVTKTFLPPREQYDKYLDKIWETSLLTNQGPLLLELQSKLSNFLHVENINYVTNGTVALQLALKTLNIDDGEIITTPFSYVATSSSILWQRSKPVFVDIESNNFTIDANKIEEKITPNTRAIMPVHVFGYACDVEKIQQIADKHNLKVIYDAAHAFGVKYKGKSLLSFGDVSTCSFHATKLFHTVEGGACIVKDKKLNDKLELMKRFGHNKDEHICLGINAKQSELHAAMGLSLLPYIEKIISDRKRVSEYYDELFKNVLQCPKLQDNLEYNYAYYPVLFESEKQLLQVFNALAEHQIYPRRYFYPSLNKISYINGDKCPVSEDISSRIACLPLYPDLENENIEKISAIIRKSV